MQKPKPVYPTFTLAIIEMPQTHDAWAGRRLRSELKETFERYKRMAALKNDPLAWSMVTIDRRFDTPLLEIGEVDTDQTPAPEPAITALRPKDDDDYSVVSSLDLNSNKDASKIERLVELLKGILLSVRKVGANVERTSHKEAA